MLQSIEMKYSLLSCALLLNLFVISPAQADKPNAQVEDKTPKPSRLHSRTDTDCSKCHNEDGWLPAVFNHDRVGFVLKFKHAEARCKACHMNRLEDPVSRACAGCHQDPHASGLGLRCESCHTEENWRGKFSIQAHWQTAFPLSGAHANVPCEECHADYYSLGFSRANIQCETCHTQDFIQAGVVTINHVQAGFSRNCQTCHNFLGFTNGVFPGHDVCLEISQGPHVQIGCRECHDSLAGQVPTGACATGTFNCINCHEHSEEATTPIHVRVGGYAYENRRCYNCHPFAERRQ